MILDSDVVIDLLRGHPAANQWLNGLQPQPLVCGIAALEVVSGARDLVDQRKIQRFLSLFPIAWPTETDMNRALNEFLPLRLAHGVGVYDCLLAATAVGLGVPVATFNTKHYRALPGVSTVQPYQR